MLSHMSQPMGDVDVLDRAPMFSPSEQFVPGLKVLSNDPSAQQTQQPTSRSDASDSTDHNSLSESDRSQEQCAAKWHSAYEAGFVPGPSQIPSSLPHEMNSIQHGGEPFIMSWWPVPENTMTNDEYFHGGDRAGTIGVKHKSNLNRGPSIFQRLEKRLEEFVWSPHGHAHHAATKAHGDDVDTETRDALSKSACPVLKSSIGSDNLFHIVLTTSHFNKDVNSEVQRVQICGTYDSLPAAKAFAHRCLFDAGYEQEWFTTFNTQHDLQLIKHRQEKIVEATGPAGEVFTVDISTIPNVSGLKSTNETKSIQTPLYHVVQTVVHYRDDESGQTRDTTIQGSFSTYARAREVAHTLLLWWEDGIDKNTYAQYEEAGPDELDCGYGESVVVHAVGQNGDNFLVSVLKGQQMEAERVSDASGAMRA